LNYTRSRRGFYRQSWRSPERERQAWDAFHDDSTALNGSRVFETVSQRSRASRHDGTTTGVGCLDRDWW